jgi:hypothetical protein
MSNAAASESKQRHRPQAKARGRGLGVRAAPEVERRRDAKGEGIPGRGSSVSFTRCEVSRSWLDGVTRSLHRQRVRFPKSDRGVRRGSSHLRLGGKKTPVPSESRDHRSAQRRRETPSAPVFTRKGEDTRKPHASGCPIDSRDWAEVGRTHLWFVDLVVSKDTAGPPADLVTRALTRRATRARTGIHKMSVFGSPRGGSSGRRGGVTNGCAIEGTMGSKPAPLQSDERESVHRTTRRNASRSCSMRPNPLHGVGARFSQVGLAGIGVSRCTA